MTEYTARVAQKFMVIKAAKGLKKEIEQAGIDNLKTLAEKGISIVGTYLQGSSPQRKQEIRQEMAALSSVGITIDMIIAEVARQMPELAPYMQGKDDYRKSEIERMRNFLLTTD